MKALLETADRKTERAFLIGVELKSHSSWDVRDSLDELAELASTAGAQVIDGTGKSVIPGLIMVHEHLFYPSAPGVYGNFSESFTRLYLAGGVTSMRTGGNMNGFGEIAIARDIKAGTKPGPWIDATAPYLEGPGLPLGQVYALKDAADARRLVGYWADAGATSFKAYMHISRDELKAAAEEAHKRGMKITGHLCSVTYREAIAAGIDDLEHGFMAATDFVKDKKAALLSVTKNGFGKRTPVAEYRLTSRGGSGVINIVRDVSKIFLQ